jgi:nucleotide-binding universal stress UspA family protein
MSTAQASQATAPRPVLVVVDDSALGAHTAEIGAAVAAAMSAEALFHFPIPIEHVEADSPTQLVRALPEHRDACRARAQPVFDAAQRAAGRLGATSDTVLTIEEVPADAVRRIAAERGCGIVVAGSHGRGALSRMLRGSLVDELLHTCDRPVLVCREDMAFGAVPALAATK